MVANSEAETRWPTITLTEAAIRGGALEVHDSLSRFVAAARLDPVCFLFHPSKIELDYEFGASDLVETVILRFYIPVLREQKARHEAKATLDDRFATWERQLPDQERHLLSSPTVSVAVLGAGRLQAKERVMYIDVIDSANKAIQ